MSLSRKSETRRPYGDVRYVRGLAASALSAWALFVVVATAVPLIAIAATAAVTGKDAIWPQSYEMTGFLGTAATFGLPLSFAVCFVVGYPVWRIANACGRTSRRDAIMVGASVGALLFLMAALASDLMVYASASNYSFAQGGVWLTRDNAPTIQGLSLQFFLTLISAAVGAVAGLAAWSAGRPVASREPDQ